MSVGGMPPGAAGRLPMGAMRGTFALLGTSHLTQQTPAFAALGLLGGGQTRSMRHGQKRGKLGRSATDR